jgi:hypothetical protein
VREEGGGGGFHFSEREKEAVSEMKLKTKKRENKLGIMGDPQLKSQYKRSCKLIRLGQVGFLHPTYDPKPNFLKTLDLRSA